MNTVLRSITVVAALAAALTASAQDNISIAYGSTTFSLPASGSATHSVTGTVTFPTEPTSYSPAGFVSEIGQQPPVDAFIQATLDPALLSYVVPVNNASNSSTYTGPIFDFTLTATTLTGVYNYGTGGYQPYVELGGPDNLGGNYPFYRLTINPAPTPEPSALAGLGLGAVALVRRRRRLGRRG